MTSINADIGGRLRQARQQRGLSLHDAARVTKLSISVLRAIERNDFASLPGGIYRKGYLRALAREVGLDPEQIAADYDQEFAPAADPVAVNRWAGRDHEWITQLTPSSRGSVVTLALSIALAIGWFEWRDAVDPPRQAVADLIPARALLATVAAPTAIYQATELAGGVTAAERSVVPIRIEMSVTGRCWVAAESDGVRALYRLVEPGERVVLEGRRLISLRLGNAGSVTLSINEGPHRVAGGDGEVVELTLTPGNVESLSGGAVKS